MPRGQRGYSGKIHAFKCYVGRKSVDIQIEPDYALHLASSIIEAVLAKSKVDITVHLGQQYKDGCYYTTVTWKK
jgi:hypothetical protein